MMRILLNGSGWMKEFFVSFKDHFMEEFKIGDIGKDISSSILQWQDSFAVGKVHFLVTDAVVVTWIAMFFFIALWIWIAAKRERIPTGRQLVSESIIDLFMTLCKSNGMNNKQAEIVTPFIGTVCFFLIACNVISAFKISPPAKNIAFPVSLALLAIVYVIVTAIRFVGLRGFWDSLLEPTPAMLPFKILDYLIKPVSLAFRLFGNIFGAFILMEFVYVVIPVIIPGILSIWFDIADGVLQAVVFTYLTTSYIGEIVESAEIAREKRIEREKMRLSAS